jgi:hypothetical protein
VVALAGLVAVSGCSHVPQVDADRSDTMARTATPSSTTPLTNEETGPMTSTSSHSATVVTNAGRIDATVVAGDLTIDVTTQDGWTPAIDRTGTRARVVWTSGGRTVAVDLEGTPTGIRQEVVSTE